MATYYDPKTDSTAFSVWARAYKTREEEKAEQERDQAQKKESIKEIGMIPIKFLEGNRGTQLQETQMLLSERDPYSDTGFKYALDKTPREKGLWNWVKHRYRSPEDRVVEKAISRPKDVTKSEILSDDLFTRQMITPAGNESFMKKVEKEAYASEGLRSPDQQLIDVLSDPDTRLGAPPTLERLQKDLRRKAMDQRAMRSNEIFEKQQISQLSDPDFRHGKFDPGQLQKNLERKAMEQTAIQKGQFKEERDLYSQALERYRDPRGRIAQNIYRELDPSKVISAPGQDLSQEGWQRPDSPTIDEIFPGWEERLKGAKLKDYDLESPGPSRNMLKAGVDNNVVANVDDSYGEYALEQMFGGETEGINYPQAPSGYTREGQVSPTPMVDDKVITTKDTNVGSDTSDLTPPYKRTDPSIYGREAYETQQVLKGNYAVDTLEADLPKAVRGKMGKELVEKAILEDTMTLPTYDSFGELVKARDAAEKGSGLYKGLQSQINQLYKRGGGTYEGAEKAFGTLDTASDIRKTTETAGDLASAVKAVDVGEDVAAVTATETAGKSVPGLGEAMAAANLYSAWGGEGTQTQKVGATLETGADLASTYALTSGNPYAMAAGGLYKVGKTAWDLLT